MAYQLQPASGVKNLHTTIGSELPSCEYSAGSFFNRAFVKSFKRVFHLLSNKFQLDTFSVEWNASQAFNDLFSHSLRAQSSHPPLPCETRFYTW